MTSFIVPSIENDKVDPQKEITTQGEESGEEQAPMWKPSLHEWLILLSLASISFMISLDGTMLPAYI